MKVSMLKLNKFVKSLELNPKYQNIFSMDICNRNNKIKNGFIFSTTGNKLDEIQGYIDFYTSYNGKLVGITGINAKSGKVILYKTKPNNWTTKNIVRKINYFLNNFSVDKVKNIKNEDIRKQGQVGNKKVYWMLH